MKSEAIVELGKPLQTIESETPIPKGKEVLLKITHSGVCHSCLLYTSDAADE